MASLCTATARSGKRCARPAIPGGAVCRYHGGAAPQVKEAAKLRLAALVDPAIGELEKLLKRSKQDAVRFAAVKDVLDRNGFKPAEKVEVTQQTSMAVILANLSVERLRTVEGWMHESGIETLDAPAAKLGPGGAGDAGAPISDGQPAVVDIEPSR